MTGACSAARVAQISAATQQAAATAAALEQSRAQRSAYISSLGAQRRLNDQQIAHLVSVAHAAAQRSTQISLVRSTGAIPPPVTPISASSPTAEVTSGRTLTVSATGYSLGGIDRDRPAGRLGHRRRRPVGDPARHAHDRAGLRRGRGRGHGRRRRRRHDRPLVPDGRPGRPVGPPGRDDHAALTVRPRFWPSRVHSCRPGRSR